QVQDGTELPPIEVSNRGHGPVRVVAYTGWGGLDLQGMPVYQDDAAARAESSRYVRLKPDELHVGPGETVPLRATVHVPDGFAGGLYPVIFLEGHPADSPHLAGVQAVPRIAVITLLTVGEGTAQVRPEAAVVRPGPGGGTLEVAVRVRNEGDVHALAGGKVTITDGSGAEVARIPLVPGLVLPGAERELVAQWLPPGPAGGSYVATVRLEGPVPAPPFELAFTLDPVPALAGAGGAGGWVAGWPRAGFWPPAIHGRPSDRGRRDGWHRGPGFRYGDCRSRCSCCSCCCCSCRPRGPKPRRPWAVLPWPRPSVSAWTV